MISEPMQKPPKALEAKAAQERLVLSESQTRALQKANARPRGRRRSEGECPSSLGFPPAVASCTAICSERENAGPPLTLKVKNKSYIQQLDFLPSRVR